MSCTKSSFDLPIMIPDHLVSQLSDQVWDLLFKIDFLVIKLETFEESYQYGNALKWATKYVKDYNKANNTNKPQREIEDITAGELEEAIDEWHRFLHTAP